MSYTDSAPLASGGSPYSNDIIMTREHKQILRDNRELLVENIDPSGLLNQLSGKKLLTDTNIAAIKEQGSRTSMNERLLDTMLCKPDRAFTEFVRALKNTEQYHLANKLERSHGAGHDECGSDSGISGAGSDPEEPRNLRGASAFRQPNNAQLWNRSPIQGSSRSGSPRPLSGIGMKRKIATSTPKPSVSMRLQASQLDADEEDQDAVDDDDEDASIIDQHDAYEEEDIFLNPPKKKRKPVNVPSRNRSSALKKQLEQEMLEYSILQHRNLKDLAHDPTNENINKSNAIIRLLRELEEHHRKILGLYSGSVVISIYCPTVESLKDLWHKYSSGRLKMLCEEAYAGMLYEKASYMDISVSVEIEEDEYQNSLQDLLTAEQSPVQKCSREKSPSSAGDLQDTEIRDEWTNLQAMDLSSDWSDCRQNVSRSSSSGISSSSNISTDNSLDPTDLTCHFGSDNSNSPVVS